GLETDEIYLNGLSSSLPEEVQDSFLRTMPGFEKCVVSRPGYAVEYDYVEPTQLFPSLETKRVAGLFNAGQINGTSGYEEAAGQGLVAGINAGLYARAHNALCGSLCCSDGSLGSSPASAEENHFQPKPLFSMEEKRFFADVSARETKALSEKLLNSHNDAFREHFSDIPDYEPLILGRDEAYIGVLIDDLVTLGTKEPYRMFTARAEYRLKLRHDTADRRLREKGYKVGLISESQILTLRHKYENIDEALKYITSHPSAENPGNFSEQEWKEAQEDFKYRYYIEKQDARVAKMHRMEHAKIPADFDYGKIVALSAESRGKLEKVRPLTLGQASRISGIRTSDIMLLMVYLH
nr:tRNA uridine-5-carboxymethylaminomethyl(34) synthesis enzyme MnmG [Treponema sp.]